MRHKKFFIVTICLLAVIIAVFASGVIVTDRSAVYSAEGLNWNGSFYKSCSGFYEEGKTIAKTSDGNWNINEVKGDTEHNFVVVRSGLDDFLLVREDYKIPESGIPNTVYLGTKKISNREDCKIISDIFLNDSETFSVSATHEDVNNWQSVSIGFDGCPVAVFRGYIGFTDGNYFFTVDLSDMKEKDDGSGEPFTVLCKSVDKSCYAMLNEYFAHYYSYSAS